MKYAAYPTSCETFTYGEVEDYTADISTGGQPPVANFSASATTITVGQSVTFTDQSTNSPTSWAWTFDGGTPSTSNLQNPTITYNTVGVFTVSLTVTNAFGSDTETKANYITVNPPPAPVANFSGSPTTIDEGQSVAFTDLSTNNPTSWLWTFVGGTPSSSTVKNPTITYNTAGTYTVELIATNLGGSDTETKVNYITVNIPSIVYCTSQGNSQTRGWISRVRVANLDNSSAASKYTDFTSKTANLTRGTSASVTLNTSYSGTVYRMYWRIWIDYNRDGDFVDTGEQVFSKNARNSVTGSFTPPTSALTGNTRMRVSMKYNGYPTSCQTFSYGEVEDYTANIQ
jgi:PKD repeat protein